MIVLERIYHSFVVLTAISVLLLLCMLEHEVWAQFEPNKECFCKLQGIIDDCPLVFFEILLIK